MRHDDAWNIETLTDALLAKQQKISRLEDRVRYS